MKNAAGKYRVCCAGLFLAFGLIACKPSLDSLSTNTNLLGRMESQASLAAFENLLHKVPEVGKMLGGKNNYTVLAPGNQAIAAMGQDSIRALISSKSGLKKLAALVQRQVITGTPTREELLSGKLVSVNGFPVKLEEADLSGASITASNGQIYIVGRCLR